MSDVYAVFGTLLALGIAFPGMLTAFWLLFPAAVERSEMRIEAAPWKSFWLGIGFAIGIGIPVGILINVPVGVLQFLGFMVLLLTLGISTFGAAGIARLMGRRIHDQSEGGLSETKSLVMGAIALGLAAVFPIVGWFLVIPASLIISLGSSLFVLFRRTEAPVTSGQIAESAAD